MPGRSDKSTTAKTKSTPSATKHLHPINTPIDLKSLNPDALVEHIFATAAKHVEKRKVSGTSTATSRSTAASGSSKVSRDHRAEVEKEPSAEPESDQEEGEDGSSIAGSDVQIDDWDEESGTSSGDGPAPPSPPPPPKTKTKTTRAQAPVTTSQLKGKAKAPPPPSPPPKSKVKASKATKAVNLKEKAKPQGGATRSVDSVGGSAKAFRFGVVGMSPIPLPEGPDGARQSIKLFNAAQVAALTRAKLVARPKDSHVAFVIKLEGSNDDVDGFLRRVLPVPLKTIDPSQWIVCQEERGRLIDMGEERPTCMDIATLFKAGKSNQNKTVWFAPVDPFSDDIIDKWQLRDVVDAIIADNEPQETVRHRKKRSRESDDEDEGYSDDAADDDGGPAGQAGKEEESDDDLLRVLTPRPSKKARVAQESPSAPLTIDISSDAERTSAVSNSAHATKQSTTSIKLSSSSRPSTSSAHASASSSSRPSANLRPRPSSVPQKRLDQWSDDNYVIPF